MILPSSRKKNPLEKIKFNDGGSFLIHQTNSEKKLFCHRLIFFPTKWRITRVER